MRNHFWKVWPGILTLIGSLLFSSASFGSKDIMDKLEALQSQFCGGGSAAKMEKKIDRIVNERVQRLSQKERKTLPPTSEITETIRRQVWSGLNIEMLCQEARQGKSSARLGETRGGFGMVGLADGYAINTAIHEAGHYGAAHLLMENTNATLTVVKYDALMTFFNELFAGTPTLESFLNLITPFKGIAHEGGGQVMGHVAFTASAPTAFSKALGPVYTQVFMSMAGVVLTSLTQITGVMIGLKIKERYPFLGYMMISGSVMSYLMELANWTAIGLSGEAALAASDLGQTAAALGVAPAVIPAAMIGVSAGMAATYLINKKYKDHKKQLKISGMSLINEGLLAMMTGNKGSVVDDLWLEYPKKAKVDKAIEQVVTLMVDTLNQRLKHHVEHLTETFKKKTKTQKVKMVIRKLLPTKERANQFITWFKKRKAVSNFQKQIDNFYTYVAKSKMEIDLSKQDKTGMMAIRLLMQGKFVKERKGFLKLFGKRDVLWEERTEKVDEYLKGKKSLPLKAIVKANIKRIKFTDQITIKGTTKRWKKAISEKGFKAVKRGRGPFFSMRHISYRNYVEGIIRKVRYYLHDYTVYQNEQNIVKMKKVVKKVLKKAFYIPKKRRDVPAAMKIINPYVKAMLVQKKERLKPHGFLDVVDKKTCEAEIKFICGMTNLYYKDIAKKPIDLKCEISTEKDCYELEEGDRLTRVNAATFEKDFAEFLSGAGL